VCHFRSDPDLEMAAAGVGASGEAEDDKKGTSMLNAVFRRDGPSGVLKLAREKSMGWKDVKVNIGFTGNSGVGKSSTINTLRDLVSPDEPGWAKVSVNEETKMPTPYEYPRNPKIKLWDLPGVGTRSFPLDSYLQKVNFEPYDAFVIIFAGRLTENDLWLAREITRMGKQFIFVRSKVHIDVENARKTYSIGPAFDVQIVLDKIRRNCQENLSDFGRQRVFLIDNFEPLLYDFGDLVVEIAKVTPKEKKEAIVRSLPAFSLKMIDEKEAQLSNRIWYVAIPAALADAIPIPGIAVPLNEKCLMEEVNMYREEFGLSEESLGRIAKRIGCPKSELSRLANLRTTAFSYTGKIGPMMKILGLTKLTGGKLMVLNYFFTTVLKCGASYHAAYNFLHEMLKLTADDARKVFAEMKRHRRNKRSAFDEKAYYM